MVVGRHLPTTITWHSTLHRENVETRVFKGCCRPALQDEPDVLEMAAGGTDGRKRRTSSGTSKRFRVTLGMEVTWRSGAATNSYLGIWPRLSCGASAGGRKHPALRYEFVGAQNVCFL